MAIDYDSLTLGEIIRLQDELSQTLKRRFERSLTLVFSDIVGSTAYVEHFGNEAGEGLKRRHNELIEQVLGQEGRLVDVAGDGAFTCFQTVQGAVFAYTQLQNLIAESNAARPREHQLAVRVGIHEGPVITDGDIVSGDSVNVAARVANSALPGQVRLTKEAFLKLPSLMRLSCRKAQAADLKGISRAIELFYIEWRDPTRFPNTVRIDELGVDVPLPDQDLITFGRLKELDGTTANDIVLEFPDPLVANQISRWHFEVRRLRDGLMLRSVTEALTEVDDTPLAKGAERPLIAGSTVRLAGGQVTLHFRSLGVSPDSTTGSTLYSAQ